MTKKKISKERQKELIIELFEMESEDEDFNCGGKETTYKRLRERVKNMKDDSIQDS